MLPAMSGRSQPRLTSRTVGRWKPARLQSRKFAVALHRGQRAIDRVAQITVVLGKSDSELLVGRHLHRDRQLRTVLHQPRDHRKKLDYETDASGFEVVECDTDAVVGIVLNARDRTLRQKPLSDEIGGIAGLNSTIVERSGVIVVPEITAS